MATVTWGARDGGWAFPTFWRPLVTPGAADTARFNATDHSTATLDAPAAIGDVRVIAGSHATILIRDVLTVQRSFIAAGGTIELDEGGGIAGGTVDLTAATVVAHGGIIDGSVWIGDLGRGLTVTAATLAATEAARHNAALAVTGTLGLADGTYDDLVLSLNAFAATQGAEIDVGDGALVLLGPNARLSLSQDNPSHLTGVSPSGPPIVLGGLGTIGNAGLIVSDALAVTIDAASFVNAGAIVLNNATVLGQSQYFLSSGLLTWDATLAPSLTLAGASFENDGTITGEGATITVSGGSFVNVGVIALGEATAEGPILLPRPHIGVLQLLSTLEIGAAVAGFSNAGTLSADLIQIEGSVGLADLGTLLGRVVFSGTLDLGGGTLDSATLAPGATYVLSGTVTNGTVLDIDGRIDATAATLIDASIFYSQTTTLTDILGPGHIVLDAATNELSYTSAASVAGLTINAGAHGLANRISISAGSVTFGIDTLISDDVAGSSLSIVGGVFVENGRIALDGSDLEIATLDGTGTITLRDSAVLTIDSIAPTAAITVEFADGTNALILPGDASGLGDLGVTVTGLAPGDLLDFTGVSADPGTVFAEPGADVTDGLLQVQGASGDQASITTNAHGLTFDAGTDPNGGTIVTVACFRHGTRIATPDGERPIETLRIGDLVLTLGGAARPIAWLGRRAYPRALVAEQAQLRPVRIAPGALGPSLPRRALYLSPLHAMLIDGLLIPVASLVNGHSISRAPIADVSYIHIELDTPDLILAEGAPSESFVDCDSRAMFANAEEFGHLYPNASPPRRMFPAPRVEEGWALESIRARLAGRPSPDSRPGALRGHVDLVAPDRIEGWAMDESRPSEPIELELTVGGYQLDCLVANRYRIDLDRAGLGWGSLGFTADLPALDPAELSTLSLLRLSDGARLGL